MRGFKRVKATLLGGLVVLLLAGCAGAPPAAPTTVQDCEAALKTQAQTAPLPDPLLTPEALASRWPLPLWPADGSAAAIADMQAVLQAQASRTAADVQEALVDASRGPVAWAQDARALGPGFGNPSPASPRSALTAARPIQGCYPATVALLLAANEAMRAINRANNARHGTRLRPADANPTAVKPSLPMNTVTGSPGFPSARAASSRVWALLLAEVFPERRAALLAMAERTANLRLIGGAHYPSDMAVGNQAGEAAFAAMKASPAFAEALAQARAERARQ